MQFPPGKVRQALQAGGKQWVPCIFISVSLAMPFLNIAPSMGGKHRLHQRGDPKLLWKAE